MIFAYVPRAGFVDRLTVAGHVPIPTPVLWYDVFDPTPEEKARMDTALGIQIPTREEMREIETSSRLYLEGEAAYMTATFFAGADTPVPASDEITFILTRRSLVTLRYSDPKPIATFTQRLTRQPGAYTSAADALTGLLDAFIDRIADILEKLATDLDALSRSIFEDHSASASGGAGGRRDLQAIMRNLGRADELASTGRESLHSLNRLLRFLSQGLVANPAKEAKEQRARIEELARDLTSLTEHALYESQKVNFLLDATLGMINIEQNRIIKIFSVAAVVFLPPTLLASVFGMNFRYMPELEWPFGYPLAVGLMVLSAALPYLYFKRKGWL
ncbi:MAG: magnesium transporter CorA family protein [Pseudomonadota bacterium]